MSSILKVKNVTICCVALFVSLPLNTVLAQNEATKAPADSINTESLTEFTREPVSYATNGHRDPFKSLAPKATGNQKKIKDLFNYEESLIRGIVSAEDDLYALAVDKDGYSYVLRVSDRVYGGSVREITRDAVYLNIAKYGRAMTIILRMESSKSTVITEIDDMNEIRKPGINITYGSDIRMKDNVMIDDVTVPSLSTRTLEEQWFGKERREDSGHSSEIKSTPKVVALLDPAVESWIELPYILDWTSVEGSGVTYEMILDDNEDFSSPLVAESQIKTSSYLLNADAGLPVNREIYWRITARDGNGGEYSCNQRYGTFKITGNQ